MTRSAEKRSRRNHAKTSSMDLDGFDDTLTDLGVDRCLLPNDGAEVEFGVNLLPIEWGLGHLSLGLPPGFLNGSSFVANRLFWIPTTPPQGSSVFIASSRLKQDLENLTGWFDALRTYGCRADRTRQFLVTAEKVSTHRFAKRIGQLFNIPVCEFKPLPKNQSLSDLHSKFADHEVCFFSRLGAHKPDSTDKPGELDRLLMLAAEHVRLLSIRGNGNTAKAAQERLALKLDTRILADPQLTPRKSLQGLLAQGATGWCLYDSEQSSRRTVKQQNNGAAFAPILELDEVKLDNYLLHWTRRRVGKWPDQAEAQYLDDLIFGSLRANHDPLSALCRILATERVISSSELTRGQFPVVCLSEVRIEDLSEIRVFRSHLARWDGLPYGVALERTSLQDLGARQVTYGDDRDWDLLADEMKPFFQPEKSTSGKIDWRTEKEWRIVGDLDLRKFGSQQAVVFVPTHADAEVVSSLSRWPIVVLSAGTP